MRNKLVASASLLLCGTIAAQGSWTQLSQSSPPSPRQSARLMAYDTSADRVVLFGGSPPSGVYLADTHVFDCQTSTWTQVPSPQAPSARYGHTMTYDAARNEVVLFGGRLTNSSGGFSNETWVFSGTNWTRRFPAHSPTGRYLASATYDSLRQVVVLFGGGNANLQSDTWEWDGSDWTLVATTIPSSQAAPRLNSGIAFDPVRGQTIIFGGRNPTTFFNGTFAWDGTVWSDVTPATRPSQRAASAMTYDPKLDRVVLFGGNTSSGAANDTWYWDGATWDQQFPGAPPSIRGNSGFVYDSVRRRCLLFGGNNGTPHYNDLWSFSPAAPADLAPFGPSCAGTVGAPSLEATDHRLPWIGDNYSLTTNGVPVNGIYVMIIGFDNLAWQGVPLPLQLGILGMPMCSLQVSVDVPIPQVNPEYSLQLPAAFSIVGTSLYQQSLVLDPLAGNPFGGLTTNGVEATIGMR